MNNQDNEKFRRLRSCFNAGYSLPQFCMDNDYKRPMIVSDSAEFLYEIYEQFWFYKKIPAQYRIIGQTTNTKTLAGLNVSYPRLHLNSFSVDSCDGCDCLLWLSDVRPNKLPTITFLGLERVLLVMFKYCFYERPLYYFIKQHKGVKVITYTHPDMIESENNSELEKRVLKENIKNELLKSNRDASGAMSDEIWTPLDEFGYTNDEVRILLDMPPTQTDWRGCTYFLDSNDKLFNSQKGKRLTAHQPEKYKNTIYLLGTCVCVGYAAPWDKAMGSYLQKILNENQEEYIVENISQFYNSRYQDIFYNLNALPVTSGDIVFICLSNAVVRDIPSFFAKRLFQRPHNYGEVYVDKYHINERGYKIVAEKFYYFLKENNWFDDYDYDTELIRRDIGRPHMFGIPEWVLMPTEKIHGNKGGAAERINIPIGGVELVKYVEKVLLPNKSYADGEIGAIVMNCNPFTLGHQYLIETAARMVQHLYIFVVEEDKSIFPFSDRIELVQKGTAHIENVTVLPSGKFIISLLTFSDYFNKSTLQDAVIDTSMDVELFASKIAPVLNIQVRFAGEEPLDRITKQYNETMSTILPKYGIRFVEIPRKTFGEGVISASRVRELLKGNQFEEIKSMVPSSTYEYLLNREKKVTETFYRKPLTQITDFEEYIDALADRIIDINIFIVSRDAHTGVKGNEKLQKLKKIGIVEKVDKQFRWSFLAFIQCGEVKKQVAVEKERLFSIFEFDNNRVMMISEGYNTKLSDACDGKIIINKRQLAVDKRGLNFVIWDRKYNKLIDSVAFDTFLDNRALRKK